MVGKFEDEPFKTLFRAKQCIVGPTALRQLAHQNRELPDNIRPLYNLSMSGVVVCFTGFRCKDDLVSTDEEACVKGVCFFVLFRPV